MIRGHSSTYLRRDITEKTEQDGAIADRKGEVDTEAELYDCSRENEYPAVDVDRHDDCMLGQQGIPSASQRRHSGG